MRKLHDQRRKMGLCIKCGCMNDNPEYSICEKCRAERREYLAKLKKIKECTEQVQEAPHDIPENHKCWGCVWSKFEGDRFFCPFPEGICAKENMR